MEYVWMEWGDAVEFGEKITIHFHRINLSIFNEPKLFFKDG